MKKIINNKNIKVMNIDISYEYKDNFYLNDTFKISKYEKMKKLDKEYYDILNELTEKLKKIESAIKTEMGDHHHIYKRTFDCPPYDYGYVCSICGNTIVK